MKKKNIAILILVLFMGVITIFNVSFAFDDDAFLGNQNDFSYSLEQDNASNTILVKCTIKSLNGISMIEFPDGKVLKYDGPYQVNVEYLVTNNGDYKIKVIYQDNTYKDYYFEVTSIKD